MPRLLLLLLLLAGLGVAGCSSADAECALCGEPASPRLRAIENTTWLVSRVTFPVAETDGEGQIAMGVDLDGIDSGSGSSVRGASCEESQRDARSALDPELVGVDSAGQSLISAGQTVVEEGRTFQGDLDLAMAEGRIGWAIRVGERDPDDPRRIELELFAVTDPIAIGPGVGPTPGQTLRARRVARMDAYVRGSRAIGFAETTELGVGGEVMLLPFDELRVGGLIVGATSVDGVLVGSIGGSFSVDALVDVTTRDLAVGPEWLDTVRRLYENAADLEPSADDPSICERVSVGFGLDAVPVELIVE